MKQRELEFSQGQHPGDSAGGQPPLVVFAQHSGAIVCRRPVEIPGQERPFVHHV